MMHPTPGPLSGYRLIALSPARGDRRRPGFAGIDRARQPRTDRGPDRRRAGRLGNRALRRRGTRPVPAHRHRGGVPRSSTTPAQPGGRLLVGLSARREKRRRTSPARAWPRRRSSSGPSGTTSSWPAAARAARSMPSTRSSRTSSAAAGGPGRPAACPGSRRSRSGRLASASSRRSSTGNRIGTSPSIRSGRPATRPTATRAGGDALRGGRQVYEGFVHTFYGLIPPEKYFEAHPGMVQRDRRQADVQERPALPDQRGHAPGAGQEPQGTAAGQPGGHDRFRFPERLLRQLHLPELPGRRRGGRRPGGLAPAFRQRGRRGHRARVPRPGHRHPGLPVHAEAAPARPAAGRASSSGCAASNARSASRSTTRATRPSSTTSTAGRRSPGGSTSGTTRRTSRTTSSPTRTTASSPRTSALRRPERPRRVRAGRLPVLGVRDGRAQGLGAGQAALGPGAR